MRGAVRARLLPRRKLSMNGDGLAWPATSQELRKDRTRILERERPETVPSKPGLVQPATFSRGLNVQLFNSSGIFSPPNLVSRGQVLEDFRRLLVAIQFDF